MVACLGFPTLRQEGELAHELSGRLEEDSYSAQELVDKLLLDGMIACLYSAWVLVSELLLD